MLYNIEQRVLAILRSIDGLNAREIFTQSADSGQLPFAVVSVEPFTMSREGSGMFVSTVPCDIRLYVQQVNLNNPLLNYYSAGEWIDKIIREFLSRPALQYQDTGLPNLAGNIGIRLQQSTSRPLRYPPGFGDGQVFWGAVIRLDVPYQQRIKINVSGDIT